MSNLMSDDNIKDLVKGERAAVETYKQVFEKYGTDATIDKLREVSADHKKTMMTLEDIANKKGISFSSDSGAWGSWAKVVTGSAKMLGEKAALKALKEGEEHGLKQYKDALDSDDLPVEVRTAIKQDFIPSQQNHINIIDNLMKAV